MAKEEEKKEEGEGEAAKPKGKKKLIIIVGAVLVLAGAGAAFAMMGGEKPKEGEEAAEEEAPKHIEAVTLDTIIVNLSENASFLKVKMTLEYDAEILAKAVAAGHGGEGGGHGGGGAGGEDKGGLPPGLIEKEAQIRDALISTLSSKAPSDVLTPDGKEQLKEELVEAVNEALGYEEGPITNIYFNEFLVQ